MLIISDRKAMEEAIQGAAGTAMMNQQGMGGAKDFTPIFKAEKENYEILNWKFALDDVEDALI